PGDKEHRLATIVKVVAGDTPETLERVAKLYGAVVAAGVYRASCIKVAEAAKVIENTQRDLNIALINELAIIFNRIGIDTLEVLGLTFKEDVPDLRNSHVIDVINELKSYGVQVFVHDPVPDPEEARNEYGLELVSWDELPKAEAMVVAVAHRQFRSVGAEAFA